jgi:hypothetical protein
MEEIDIIRMKLEKKRKEKQKKENKSNDRTKVFGEKFRKLKYLPKIYKYFRKLREFQFSMIISNLILPKSI